MDGKDPGVGRMRDRHAEVEEERAARCRLAGASDRVDGVVDEIGGQLVVGTHRGRDGGVAIEELWAVLIRPPHLKAVEAIEAALQRERGVAPGLTGVVARAQVPLPHREGRVAGTAERLGQELDVRRHLPLVCPNVFRTGRRQVRRERRHPHRLRVSAGQQ